ncbi:MAG: tRNA dihydrouridine synthase DusB [Treponema sp.]|jgi:nifR3 family TIM-barrel protein|nr:tRNA dihydrouridine synthase DusB [Treponema sp.]
MQLYHSVQIGELILEGNLFLAPVAGYSDRAFRSICIEQGANFTCTELVSSEALIRGPLCNEKNSMMALLRRADNEVRYGIQLFGADPEVMGKAAALLTPWKPSAIDINAGCPVPKVVKTGAGSALMKNPAHLGRIVEAVVRTAHASVGKSVPVTVKMRSGWDAESINYQECARIAVESGASMVSLHSRTRSQAYSGKSNWAHLADLVTRAPVPVTGSGDLFSPEDARRMLEETGCAAVMFARGAMGDPFIFTATKDLLTAGSYSAISGAAKIAAGFRQLLLLSADIGEGAACREMRKHFCAYTRGIPHGAEIRNCLVHAETITEYERILGIGNNPPFMRYSAC